LVDDARWETFRGRRDRIERLGEVLRSVRSGGASLAEHLRRPSTTWDDLRALHPALDDLDGDPSAIDQVTFEAKYHGYIERQAEQIARFQRLEAKPLPANLDYRAVAQLRVEAIEKFSRVRPRSFGQAGRISGITPADLATLLIHLKRGQSTTAPATPGSSPDP
jgi:tRNA uridine 5-carboxymethylaminomethyl modification enzyme